MFTDLPDDIFLYLIQFLPYQSDLNALARANGYLYALLNPVLYRHNVKHGKCSALRWAAQHDKASTARKMLDEGGPLDAGTKDLWRLPIALAVRNGNDSIVSLFIEKGLDLKSPYAEKESSCRYLANHLFHQAVINSQESMARRILPYRLDLKTTRYNGCSNCWTFPISQAASEGSLSLLRLLMDLGYGINAGDGSNDTPLIIAAVEGHNDIVSFLIECGANLEHEGSWGTALTAAAGAGHFAVVKTLIAAGARPDPVSSQGDATLMSVAEAANAGHFEIVRFLLDRIDTDQKIVETGNDPHLLLRTAALAGLNGIIERLLNSGDAVVGKLKERGTLDYFGTGWADALELATRPGSLELMKLLLDASPPNVRDRFGRALENAVRGNAIEEAKLLLDYGADPNTKDYIGRRILGSAVYGEEIFELLLDYGATLEPAREKGEDNMLAQVIESGSVGLLEKVLKRGVKMELPRRTGTTLLKSGVRGGEKMMQFLFDHGMCIPAPCKMVDQCMVMAARTGQPAVLQSFLDRGYPSDSDTQQRVKLLEIASDGDGHGGDSYGTVDLLIRYGADLEAKNKLGETALWCHARGGHEGAVQLLLDMGADPLSRNPSDECVLKVAAQSGNAGVVRRLLRAISRRGLPWTAVKDAWSQANAATRDQYPKVTRELDVFYCRTMFPVVDREV